jgi:hypothetical protein
VSWQDGGPIHRGPLEEIAAPYRASSGLSATPRQRGSNLTPIGESSEQGGGAMTLVVVGDAFEVAEPHRKHGLGAFEGLDLALLIDAKHHCLVRWVEIIRPLRAASRRRTDRSRA